MQDDAEKLVAALQPHSCIVVAFSGGVDSSVVAAAAFEASRRSTVTEPRAIAVTAHSPSVPQWQRQIASKVAAEIGIEHHELETAETQLAQYRRNDRRRCYFCKDTLYTTLVDFARSLGRPVVIASGTNADDLGDFRPGIEAGDRIGVIKPLAELGYGKAAVRQLAESFKLSNHDLPASPCLASRIAYGTEVTVERLSMVERAEVWLRQQGFIDLRVRLHADELARIEVPRDQIRRLIELDEAGELTSTLNQIGFRFVTVDLQGLQSGSLNRVLVTLTDDSIGKGRPVTANASPGNSETTT